MVKKIGIVGGLGPESSLYYYRVFIDLCHAHMEMKGNYPELIIYNMTLKAPTGSSGSRCFENGAEIMLSVLRSLHRAGVDFGIIACNTAHRMFDDVKAESPIPIISIVEETCNAVRRRGLKKVGLFGSVATMTSSFYPDVFSRSDISIAVPNENEQSYIYEKILNELISGIFLEDTRSEYVRIARRMLEEESIEGLILGCTEIPLLLDAGCEKRLGIPLFDTSRIHMQSAFEYACGL